MTTPSSFQSLGLSLHLFQPDIAVTVAVPNTAVIVPEARHYDEVSGKVDSYSHTIDAVGGFKSADFTISTNLMDLERWYQNAMGMHVVTKDEAADVVWEGRVDTLSINVGPLSVTLGPLVEIGNQIVVHYAEQQYLSEPPCIGIRKWTTSAENYDSQVRYGIVPLTLSTADMTDAQANQYRDRFIAERAFPTRTNLLNLAGGGANPTVTFGCLGYGAYMRYPYRQITAVGTQNLSAKLADILDADPNALFSSANADITANTLAVNEWVNDGYESWDLIAGLVAQGDAAFDRYIAGVYEDRRFVYAQVPAVVEYHQRISDNRQIVTTVAGAEVFPWAVRPGKWLQSPDWLAGRTFEGNLRDDPRIMFVESVTYTAPWGVQLRGGKANTIDQMMSQWGLAGSVS